jgi:hypothetical protein
MPANFCDVFAHKSGKLYLAARSGVLLRHLGRFDWELVLRHRPMPTFAREEVEKRGYAVWRSGEEPSARAKHFYN